MNYLTDDTDCNSNNDYDFANYVIKSQEFLPEKIKKGMPTPFVVNASNECTFLCFSIACTKNTHEKLCASNYRRTCECVLLVTKIEGDDNFYYAEISNN